MTNYPGTARLTLNRRQLFKAILEGGIEFKAVGKWSELNISWQTLGLKEYREAKKEKL